LAISKERKDELVKQYAEWAKASRAMIIADYRGLSVKEMQNLRHEVREAGGEFHVVKNTLSKLALESAGLPLDDQVFEGTTAIGFAFEDAPGLAKAITDFSKDTDFLRVKGGYLEQEMMSAEQIRALAELPPLPEMRARLLGTLMAPANQLARVLAEPGRQLARVFQAYAEREAEPDAA
jgi:large subunit ribosomal protein L10